MARKLTQSELEQLSAWLDGELSQAQAEQVSLRVAADEDWARSADELRRLDGLLATWQAPPLRGDLTDRVLARARTRRGVPAWLKALAPLAAAAVIVLAASLHYFGGDGLTGGGSTAGIHDSEDPLAGQMAQVLQNVKAEDRFVAENLDLFQDYEVLAHLDTLEALEQLDSREGM